MGKEQKLTPRGCIERTELAGVLRDGHRPLEAFKGRGAVSNQVGRFERLEREAFDDGWNGEEDDLASPLETTLNRELARSIISFNQSPDISFDRSINPYRGCEHGCVYCFARPSHAYLGHSAGLDFETRLYVKENAVTLLKKELAAPSYQPRPLALGVNTDAYQPLERRLCMTRGLLEVLATQRHPVSLITKSALITRDMDLIAPLAEEGVCRVAISLTTLNAELCRRLEPRAAAPHRRLKTIEALANAGVPVTVMMAPIIPALNEDEIEMVLASAASAGAQFAGYVLLRLPHELKDIFHEWLASHAPDRAARVINTLREMRGGRDYDADWQVRGRGTGERSRLIGRRFVAACRRHGLNRDKRPPLRTDLFRKPPRDERQMILDI